MAQLMSKKLNPKTMTDKSIFIKCGCGGEGMGVDYDAEDKLYYFSYWSCGLSNKPLSWREKIRYCWNVLSKGKAFNDEIILNKEQINKLENFILACGREEF